MKEKYKQINNFLEMHPEIQREYLIKIKHFEEDELESAQAQLCLVSSDFIDWVFNIMKELNVLN